MNDHFSTLRHQAEQAVSLSEIDVSALSDEDIRNLIHNLEVHRVELEMQNEELQRANAEAEDARRKYRDLFEFAPVGYLTLDRQFTVLEVNQTFARLLGMRKPQLLGLALTDLICPDSQDAFYLAMQQAPQPAEPLTLDVQLRHADHESIWAHLEIRAAPDRQSYRMSVNDVTRQKTAEQKITTLNRRIEASLMAGDMAWWEMELPAGHVVFNHNKTAMLGLRPEQFTHYAHFMDRVHPDDYDTAMDACRLHVRGEAELYECEYRIRAHDDGYLWFHDVGRIIERHGERVKLVGIVTNVTARKYAEQRLQEALAEKEVLLQEVHHRVKNNMQTIAGLLHKQRQFMADASICAVLDDSIQRVKSMAMIHEHIYRSKNLARIHLPEYLRNLSTALFRAYKPKGCAITLTVEIDEVALPIDLAIPVALIVNELLTNALKYAFPDQREGEIRITGRQRGDDLALCVSDNGVGLPDDFDLAAVNSLGLYLVQNLSTKQLGGTLDIDGQHGTEVTMTFRIATEESTERE